MQGNAGCLFRVSAEMKEGGGGWGRDGRVDQCSAVRARSHQAIDHPLTFLQHLPGQKQGQDGCLALDKPGEGWCGILIGSSRLGIG